MSTSASGQRFSHRWLIVLGIVLMLGVVQTPWGLGTVARWALYAGRVNIAFESLHGFWMHSLEVRGIEGNVGTHRIRVDTVRVELSAGRLITGRLHARYVELIAPTLQLDSTLSVSATERAETADGINANAAIFLWIDALNIKGGSLSLGDESVNISDINLRGSMLPDAIQVDTVYGEVLWQDIHTRFFAVARMQFDRGILELDTLVLSGSGSNIRVHGQVGQQTELEVAAAPLSTAILRPLLPNIVDDLVVGAQLTGGADSLYLALNGESSAGAALKLRAGTRIGAPHVNLDTLQFERLDPVNLWPDVTGELTGSIHGRVDGTSWDSLSGAIEVALEAGMLANIPIESMQLTGTLEAGNALVELNSRLALGSLDLSGEIRPFPANGQLTGQFKNLNTRVLDSAHSSVLNGNLNLAWDSSMVARVEFSRGRIGQLDVTGGELQLFSENERTELVAAVNADSSWLELELSRQESGLAGKLNMHELDIPALMNQEDAESRLNLAAELTTNWPPDSIAVRVDLAPSSWGQVPIVDSHLEMVLQGLDLDVRGQVEFPSGHALIQGHTSFGINPPRWALTQGQIEGINLSDLGVNLHTDLNAQLQLSGSGLMNVDGELIVEPSVVNDESIAGGTISLDMADGEAVMDSRFLIGSGGLDVRAIIQPFSSVPTIDLTGGTFERIDLGPLLGLDSLSTQLKGRIDSVRWGESGEAVLTLESSTVNALAVREGQVHVQALGDTLAMMAAIALDDGYIRLDSVRVEPGPAFLARGSVRNLPLLDLGFLDAQLTGSFDVAAVGSTLQTMTVHHASVVANGTEIGEVQFDRLMIEGGMRDGEVRLSNFDISSNAGWLTAEGGVALFGGASDSLRFRGAIINAAPLADWTGGEPVSGAQTDTLWGQVMHHMDTLRWAGGVTIGPMAWKTMRIFRTFGYAEGTLLDFKPGISRAEIDIERVSVPNLSAQQAWLRLDGQQSDLGYQARIGVDERRSLYMEGKVDIPERRGVLERLDMYLNEEQWHLGVPAEILAGEGIRIRYFVLESQEQEITLDGILNPDGEQRLGLSLYNVGLAPFTDILGFPGLGGVASADLFFHGPATAPELEGSLGLIVNSEGERVGDVSARIRYAGNGLDTEAQFTHVDGSTLSISGLLPLDLRLKKQDEISFPEASMTLQADRFNLGWINPFLSQDEISNIQGRLTADIGITGFSGAPNLTGEFSLSDGYAELPQLKVTPTAFQLEATMADNTVYVQRLNAESGRGTVEGYGQVILTESGQEYLDLNLELEDFRVVNTSPYAADVSGSLAFGGTVRRPVLTGHIEMANAVIRPQDVPVDLSDGMIHFTEADLQMLEQYFNIRASVWDTTTYSLVDALAMDLSIGVPGTVRLHSLQNPEMNVLLSGSVALYKEPYQEQELQGTVSIVPELSYLRQFGRRFDIRRGRVTFAGPATNPFFDLQAALDIPNRSGQDTPVTILLDAAGRLQEPESLVLELRSEPVQLDRADMISYMATGRPAADAFQLGGGSALQSGGDLALRQLSSLVAGAAGAGLGLDVVQIDTEAAGGVTVTAGKYVSRKLFASVKWPITKESTTTSTTIESNKELVIEYALYPWLLARMRGDAGAVGLSLLYQYTW